jgi:hypothetical protein
MCSPEWSPGPQVEKYSSSARLNGVQGPEWIATACDVGVAPELLAGELQHLPARQLDVTCFLTFQPITCSLLVYYPIQNR